MAEMAGLELVGGEPQAEPPQLQSLPRDAASFWQIQHPLTSSNWGVALEESCFLSASTSVLTCEGQAAPIVDHIAYHPAI